VVRRHTALQQKQKIALQQQESFRHDLESGR
jgi:hypothetical protein